MPATAPCLSVALLTRLQCREATLVSATPEIPTAPATEGGLKALGTDELAEIAATKDRKAAWRILYERSYAFLIEYADQLEGDPDRAEDLVQETLLKAWSNREKYDPHYPWVAWIRTILKRESFSRQRHQRAYSSALDRARPQAGDGLWHGRAPEDTGRGFERREARRLLDEVVSQLTEMEREVLLAWSEGAKIVDLAEEWGQSASTLRGRLWRARNRLNDLAEEVASPALLELAEGRA